MKVKINAQLFNANLKKLPLESNGTCVMRFLGKELWIDYRYAEGGTYSTLRLKQMYIEADFQKPEIDICIEISSFVKKLKQELSYYEKVTDITLELTEYEMYIRAGDRATARYIIQNYIKPTYFEEEEVEHLQPLSKNLLLSLKKLTQLCDNKTYVTDITALNKTNMVFFAENHYEIIMRDLWSKVENNYLNIPFSCYFGIPLYKLKYIFKLFTPLNLEIRKNTLTFTDGYTYVKCNRSEYFDTEVYMKDKIPCIVNQHSQEIRWNAEYHNDCLYVVVPNTEVFTLELPKIYNDMQYHVISKDYLTQLTAENKLSCLHLKFLNTEQAVEESLLINLTELNIKEALSEIQKFKKVTGKERSFRGALCYRDRFYGYTTEDGYLNYEMKLGYLEIPNESYILNLSNMEKVLKQFSSVAVNTFNTGGFQYFFDGERQIALLNPLFKLSKQSYEFLNTKYIAESKLLQADRA